MNTYKIRNIEYFSQIKENILFLNLSNLEINYFINNVNYEYKVFNKDEIIKKDDIKASKFAIILSGQIIYYAEDFFGNCNILIEIKSSESFIFSNDNISFMNLMATEKTEILFFDLEDINKLCQDNNFSASYQLTQNILRIMTNNYLSLINKLNHVMKRSLREKILSYLNHQKSLTNSNLFHIPFNRQELADYLAVDRSALSAELSRMKKEGILNYYKNSFELINYNNKK